MSGPATPILRTAGIRALEARHAVSVQPPLMERAGAAVARAAQAMALGEGPVLILAGPGNNGGDGFVAARLLKEQGVAATLVFIGNAEHLPHDAKGAFDTWRWMGGETHAAIPPGRYALAIDALFGIGLTRPLEGRPAELIDEVEALGCPILAVDIPSGLCADTGRVLGRCLHASRTLSFIAGKPGLYTLDGPDHCGEVVIDTLGIADAPPEGQLITTALFAEQLRPRPRNSHKGSFGSVAIVGGAPGMAGAALLAGRAALRLGAGRVYVGMIEQLAADPLQPELMLRAAEEVLGCATALVVGPGLGQSAVAIELVRAAVASNLPLVLDADALNNLASHPVLFHGLARREAASLLTPHPAEAARLLGWPIEAVQADRLAAAQELARRGRAHVLLKGCGSILAAPDSHWYINTTGNPGLATAGSGDVLAGMIGALLAQHWPATAAFCGAVHLHGAAADELAARGIGPVGLAAGELIDAARLLLNRHIANG
jgi:hydroxyethylthiazole kinase-like uncharacterized protein yjeF